MSINLLCCISFLLGLSISSAHAQFSALDNSFGQGGLVVQDIAGMNDYFFAHEQQADGKTIAVGIGKTDSTYNHVLAVRYLENGSPDSSFADNGIFCKALFQQADEWGMELHIQSDGKILIAGKVSINGGGFKILVLRLTSNGELDSTFATNGIFVFANAPYNHFASDIGLQSDGSIILTGFYQDQNVLACFVGKLKPQGSIDSSFGTNGWYISTIGNVYQDVQRVQVQPDDKIIFTASTAISSNGTDILVTRLTANGQLDNSFNQTGTKIIDLCCGEYGYALKLQNDGKILIGGSGIDTPNTGRQFLLLRLHADGRYDSSFNGNGIVFTEINNQGSRIFGLTINPNGKIIATGYNADGVSIFNVAFACYQTNGQLDPNFNNTGIRTYSFASGHEYPECITVQANGKIVVSGFLHNGNSMQGFVTRLQGEWPVENLTVDHQDMYLYPNPAQDKLYIQFGTNTQIKEIIMYDILGKVMRIYTDWSASPYCISTHGLLPGHYILECTDSKNVSQRAIFSITHN